MDNKDTKIFKVAATGAAIYYALANKEKVGKALQKIKEAFEELIPEELLSKQAHE